MTFILMYENLNSIILQIKEEGLQTNLNERYKRSCRELVRRIKGKINYVGTLSKEQLL